MAALRISDELIASTDTPHVAWRRPDAAAGERSMWVVSWLPLRLLTKEQVLAAMMLAEAASRGIKPDDQQRVESWAHELGLTGSEAIARLTEE
ncbi:MAG: hypothetical protein M3319_13895 [Actinomycetota bacterium]|nr:hypothetical protein [Actinomycetota bacterium]MDQ3901474.1 hypothetical protein [Actinomycetota bacterium]